MLTRTSLLFLTILGISLVNANIESDAVEALKEKLAELEGSSDEQGSRKFVLQGDILLTMDEARDLVESVDKGSIRHKRQAQRRNASNENLWVDGVKYVFDPSASEKLKHGFKLAANAWQKDTCINFTLVNSKKEVEGEDYLYVTVDPYHRHECSSHVGKLGKYQPIFLGEGCEAFPHAAHEVGHALGLYHTQSRHDRDQYIELVDERIEKEDLGDQFIKLTEEKNENYELPYDYGSIMHYGSSIENAKIIPKDKNYKTTMGSPLISFVDLLMINKHYNCTDWPLRDCETVEIDDRNLSANWWLLWLINSPPNILISQPKDCEEGKQVKAKESWDNFFAYFKSPKEDGSYATCTYWITAPENKKIEIKVESVSTKEPAIGCATGGVEIKANSNHTLTGYRYCEIEEDVIIKSHSNRVPIILYTAETVFQTVVSLKYHYARIHSTEHDHSLEQTSDNFPSRSSTNEASRNAFRSSPQGYRRQKYALPQVNTEVHATQATKSWLLENRANVMDWPTCSPGLNSMDNLSSILARWVRCNHRQFQTTYELKTTIIDAWEDVESDFLKNLMKSVLNRPLKWFSTLKGR
ncbi:astacin [Ancylostoma caninum]|uniref:Metalloendopeptidase n=1 Tax=Ancylostoma caninum TaxID=29170 RepID=A0A368H5M5_ANCCA|nr:astacin [Ancylostoma caninum]